MSLRSFIAVQLDPQNHAALGTLIRRLQQELPSDKIKWVSPATIHLTLKFLGDVQDNLIVDLSRRLSETVALFDPFAFVISGLGCFPPRGPARVLWCGIHEGTEDLRALAEAIDQACGELGFDLEHKRFTPHLTLARIKDPRTGHEIREYIEALSPAQAGIFQDLGSQEVSEIALMHSQLDRSGPTYTPMHRAALGAN